MTAEVAHADHAPAGHGKSASAYRESTINNRMGLWMFIISDSFVFIGLMVTRFYLLGGHRPELNQFLGLIVTSVLLISSFCMNRAEVSMAHGDRKGFVIFTIITMLLGLGFLGGVVGVEWPLASQHFGADTGPEGSVFFMMTGMHAFHVLTGVLFLGIVLYNGAKGRYSTERHWPVEACANYWHFVDLVWIFFYPALYLIGTVAG